MHDGGRHREKTFAALQIIVPALEEKGYRFVAAEDLFKE
jgi:peptidoglycan/xylan/chitin deacetylase (PgdA/CDA1 family)